MHITVVTIGSRGDVQPFVALGLSLHQAGHTFRIVTHLASESFVTEYGLEFMPVSGVVKLWTHHQSCGMIG